MIWLILISFFIALIIWILIGPVIIYIDTENNRYFITLPPLFTVKVVPYGEFVQVRGRVLFVPFHFDPLKSLLGGKKKPRQKTGKKKRKIKFSGGMGTINAMTRAIRIRRLHLDIDTDDFLLNAWLIPVFSCVNSENIRLRVNYQGNASLLLEIRTRLGALIWNYFRSKYKSFFNF